MRSARSAGIFYGWFIVAAGAFALFVSMGARNGFGVFVVPMTTELDWTRTEISAAIAIGVLINGLSQPFLGRLYDRFGGRSVISISLLVLGVSTMLLAFTGYFDLGFALTLDTPFLTVTLTSGLLFLIVMYGFVMSTASSGVSLVTIHAMLAKWFYRRRGMVLSLCTAGTSAGGLILTPFAAALIITTNWRVAWVILGAIVLLLALPLVWLIVRDSPDKIGEAPDGERLPPNNSAAGSTATRQAHPRAPLESDSWKDSFRHPPIWQLSGAYFVCGVTTIIISTHYVPFAIDLGVSPAVAAWAFGMMQGLNAVGVTVVGFLADRFSRKNLLGAIYFIRFLAYVALVAPSFSNAMLGTTLPPALGIWAFAALAGLSWIATPPLTSSLTADIYGLKNIGTLGGISTFAHQIGGSISVLAAGILYDVTGAYEVPFALAGLTLLGATVASLAVKERKYSARYQTVAPATAPAADGAR